MTGILYISYDGMLEPLGQSQVLAYLEKLAPDHDIDLISFEKRADWSQVEEREAMRRRITAARIRWHPLTYHKRLSALATAWDVLRGALYGWRLVRRQRISIVHARSYVPAVMALFIKRATGARLLFDMRGFWADERVDGGLWSRGGWLYRIAKRFERRFLLDADHVVLLTNAAVAELRRFPYLQKCMPPATVIPTCADLSRFRPADEKSRDGFVMGYVGSVGTWHRFDAVLICFQRLQLIYPDARLRIINRGEHSYIRQCLAKAGVPEFSVELKSASYAQIPVELMQMHAGIFFYKPSYSRIACSPTRLAEFLGCGIPCLSNAGVGDVPEILGRGQVGVVVGSFDAAVLDAALGQLMILAAQPDTTRRCVDVAHQYFSLEEGSNRYAMIYRSLASF